MAQRAGSGWRPALLAAVAALAIAGASVGAGASTGSAAKPVRGGSFTYLMLVSSPPSWDPTSGLVQAGPGADGPVYAAVFGMLVYEDFAKGEVVPWMAKSLTPTDARNWVLKLREGVKFTDDTPYNAEAVKYNWERYADPANRSPSLAIAQEISSLTVADQYTLNITLKEPNSFFDRLVAEGLSYIGSPTALRNDLAKFRLEPVAAGPFVVKSHQRSVETVVTRNPKYWDQPRPYLDTLTFEHIGDDSQRYSTFVAGQGQLMRTNQNSSVIDQARSAGTRMITIRASGGGNQNLLFNTARAPFDDPIARKAIQLGLDRQSFNDTLFTGLDGNPRNYLEKESPFYDERAGRLPGYNAKKAQQLLDQYATKTGKPLSFTITGSSGFTNVLQYLQAQLSQFKNLEVKINPIAGNTQIGIMTAGNYDVATYVIVLGDPGVGLGNFLKTGGAQNFGKYSNAQMDQALTQGQNAVNDAARTKAYARVQELIIEDVPFVTISRFPEIQLATKEVRGLKYHVWGQPLFQDAWLART